MATFPIQLNENTVGTREPANAAVLKNGNVVVAWGDSVIDGQDDGIAFRILNPDGTLRSSSDIQANTFTANSQLDPHVVALETGNFLITWSSFEQIGESNEVYGQIFTPLGQKLGGEFLINTTIARIQSDPSAAALADGGFVVVWTDSAMDGSGTGVVQQRFDLFGNRVGSETLVNTNTTDSQWTPEVSSLQSGGWVVAWADLLGANTVRILRYAATGAPAGTESVLSSAKTPPSSPHIAT